MNEPQHLTPSRDKASRLRKVAPLQLVAEEKGQFHLVSKLSHQGELFWADIRAAAMNLKEARNFTGQIRIEARTSLALGVIPTEILEPLLRALEPGLKRMLAGESFQEAVNYSSDFGKLQLSLNTAPVVAKAKKPLAPAPHLANNPTAKVSKEGRVKQEQESAGWQPNAKETAHAIRRLLTGSPESGETRLAAIARLKTNLLERLAEQFQEPLQGLIANMPSETRSEKQQICTYVNGKLREVGLAVRCPNTGKPALLMADEKGSGSDISRFRWEIHDEQGKKKRTASSTTLPTLELCAAEPRKEGLVEWTLRTHEKSRENKKFER